MTLKETAKENKISDKYSDLIKNLLFHRGVKNDEEAEIFLNPDYERDINDPFLMKDMEKSINRLYVAIKENQKIAVFSDYDADGIPGAVLFSQFLDRIGYENYFVYIPDRHLEGYGLNKIAIDKIKKENVELLITIDLGITAVEEVSYANELGLEVIVTDHHLPQSKLPEAYSILNPKQPGDEYPDDMLCGSGVIFKFVQGFLSLHRDEFQIDKNWEKNLLDLVGIATLSDMVPLLKENRALSYFGLKLLKMTRRPGLVHMFQKTRLKTRNLVEDDITFTITPKLNAASRMENPMRAFDFLRAKTNGIAEKHGDHLLGLNEERKTLVSTIMRSVHKTLKEREEREIIVIGDPAWRVGVLGIVAGKIVDEYKKPTFVWGLEGGDTIKGSCRSDGTINLVDLMTEVEEDILSEFGGHAGAGGFSVQVEKIHFLEEKIIEVLPKIKRIDLSDEDIDHEAEVSSEEVNRNLYNEINKLAPFGVGNPKPVLLIKNAKVLEYRKFGKNKEHLEVVINRKGSPLKAIAFFKNLESFNLDENDEDISIYGNIERNTFMGKDEIRIRILEIRKS